MCGGDNYSETLDLIPPFLWARCQAGVPSIAGRAVARLMRIDFNRLRQMAFTEIADAFGTIKLIVSWISPP